MRQSSIVVLGGGCFGITAAIELRARGWDVTLIDQGSIPFADAASTDISKVVRMDYGADEQHTAMGEAAIAGWREWNRRWGEPLFHEAGLLVPSRVALRPGTFEGDSHAMLVSRGHTLRRLSRETLRRDHPAWSVDLFQDGYLNPEAGWVESGRVIARLAIEARRAGVAIVENIPSPRLLIDGSRCAGVASCDGAKWLAARVLVAAGAWTPVILPHLADVMCATAQPVFHFKPRDAKAFTPPAFPVWFSDLAGSGWYGFPANADGIVKVAEHGRGRRVQATDPRVMPPGEEPRFREFLREAIPSLADAPLAGTRVCLYCDTFDYSFWIDRDERHEGLIVAAGDSGHAFKFAPVLGGLIADVVENAPNAWLARYRARKRAEDSGLRVRS